MDRIGAHRVGIVSDLFYRVLAPARPGRLLPERLAQRLRRRLIGMPADEVVAGVAALEAAGVDVVVCGGWGVDALLGRQTRRHGDLDLLVHPAAAVGAAAEALAPLGYAVVNEAAEGGHWAPVVTVLHNDAGRIIELLPAVDPPSATTGTLTGRPVRCLTADQQMEYHRGYRPTSDDRADVARLVAHYGLAVASPMRPRPGWSLRDLDRGARRLAARVRHRPSSALVVVAPEAEPLVADWRGGLDPSASRGVPAHVTVLYPFLPARRLTPEVRQLLARVAASVPAFDFSLERVGRFPGVIYLAPDADQPFLNLLEAVQRHWPDLEPYGGEFDTVVPHLTVADGAEPDGMVPALEAGLPLSVAAEALTLLVERRNGRWRVGGQFPLGRP